MQWVVKNTMVLFSWTIISTRFVVYPFNHYSIDRNATGISMCHKRDAIFLFIDIINVLALSYSSLIVQAFKLLPIATYLFAVKLCMQLMKQKFNISGSNNDSNNINGRGNTIALSYFYTMINNNISIIVGHYLATVMRTYEIILVLNVVESANKNECGELLLSGINNYFQM